MVKAFFSMLLPLSLAACNASTASFQASLSSRSLLDSPRRAAQNISGKVTPEEELDVPLRASDRVIKHGTYHSFYRTVQVEAKNNGYVEFKLRSLCSCLGFDKRIAVPAVLAFDTTGARLQLEALSYAAMGPTFLDPVSVALTGRIATSGAEVFRLVVFADNSAPDSMAVQIIQTDSSDVGPDIYTYPVGDLSLSITPY